MKSLQDKFLRYHLENPQIYSYFKRYAKQAKEAGFEKYSAKAIFERIRWYITVERKKSDGFKVNNNYTAFYARMLMNKEPEFEGFFELREQKHEKKEKVHAYGRTASGAAQGYWGQ